MTDVSFDRLRDVELRDAWPHEANDFTPWLAQNIEHIAKAIGIRIEITGTEVQVGNFYADILARNLQDDGLVLIENQLGQTDHTHLGQIMTYLAGLEAKTVIWIAPSFREPHLSAIRWLNQHTADGFSFFALRLRVVRIGDSPFAPIFEVVEKPNDWDSAVRTVADATQNATAAARNEFWGMYLDRYPEAAAHGINRNGGSNKLYPILPGQLFLGRYIANETCGVYVRGPSRAEPVGVAALLASGREEIEARLGATLHQGGDWFAVKTAPYPLGDRPHWPDAIEFLETQSRLYLATLTYLFGNPAA